MQFGFGCDIIIIEMRDSRLRNVTTTPRHNTPTGHRKCRKRLKRWLRKRLQKEAVKGVSRIPKQNTLTERSERGFIMNYKKMKVFMLNVGDVFTTLSHYGIWLTTDVIDCRHKLAVDVGTGETHYFDYEEPVMVIRKRKG